MMDFKNQIRLAQQGDDAARDWIVCEFDWVVARACRSVQDHLTGELSHSDMRQEAWMRVWRQIEHFRFVDDFGNLGGFAGWLTKTARNVCLNIVTRRQGPTRRPQGGWGSIDQLASQIGPQDAQTASSIARKNELREIVLGAIDNLPSSQWREIIRLRFFENQTLKQIAANLSLTYDQVRYAFHQALRHLSDALHKTFGDLDSDLDNNLDNEGPNES